MRKKSNGELPSRTTNIPLISGEYLKLCFLWIWFFKLLHFSIYCLIKYGSIFRIPTFTEKYTLTWVCNIIRLNVSLGNSLEFGTVGPIRRSMKGAATLELNEENKHYKTLHKSKSKGLFGSSSRAKQFLLCILIRELIGFRWKVHIKKGQFRWLVVVSCWTHFHRQRFL